jgi:hypothetical protein
VYIREAQPEDGWVVTTNRVEDVRLTVPTSDGERREVATTCALRLGIEIPVVVDRIVDGLASAYGALPDRLYLIGCGGHVAVRGEPGRFGFRPVDLERAIRTELDIAG